MLHYREKIVKLQTKNRTNRLFSVQTAAHRHGHQAIDCSCSNLFLQVLDTSDTSARHTRWASNKEGCA